MMEITNEHFHPFTASAATEQNEKHDSDIESTGSIEAQDDNLTNETTQKDNLSKLWYLRLGQAILKAVRRDFPDGFVPKSVETHINFEDCPKGNFRK